MADAAGGILAEGTRGEAAVKLTIMAKLAFSTIALPAYDQAELYPAARAMGFTGIEVAPSRVWRRTDHELTAEMVASYRRQVEAADLEVTGLHSLLYDRPELSLFGNPETADRTIEFLAHLSAVCRDLGGSTLVFGSPPARRRGALSPTKALAVAVDFFVRLCPRLVAHGTRICLEPLSPQDCDFANSLHECLQICRMVDSPSMRIQLDARALSISGEIGDPIIDEAAPLLIHVHANQRDFGVLSADGDVDHKLFGAELRRLAYEGFVSAEQRMLSEHDPLGDLAESAAILRQYYA